VGGEEAAVSLLCGGTGGADHYGDEGNGFGVGFEGVVVSVVVLGWQVWKEAGCVQ
jgi:hypothetical protein